ncbi:MAG: CHAP domain-containing protein [Patescibacteria group bacterium]|nr:CHAP domain-containing protein [Patescibacteria group bacterium]
MEEEPQQNIDAKQPQKGNRLRSIIIGVAAVFVLSLLPAAAFAGIWSSTVGRLMRDPAPNTTNQLNQYTCKSWANAPVGAEQKFSNAAGKFGIHPALLGAIFLQENGGGWKADLWTSNMWPSSNAGASGPFQFMPDTWKGMIAKSDVKTKCDNPTESDVNNIDKASCVASYFIADKLKNSGITNDVGTTKEQDIKDVAVAYTSSYDYFNNWRKSGRDPSKLNPDYLNYHENVWKYFQDLSQGCEQINTGSDNKIVQTAVSQLSYQASTNNSNCAKYNPDHNCVTWCANFATWVYEQAKLPIGNRSQYQSAESLKDFFQKNQELLTPDINNIKPGDTLFYKGQGTGADIGSTVTHHVGIATTVVGNEIDTIDGNASGDKVKQEKYKIENILAVGRWKQ